MPRGAYHSFGLLAAMAVTVTINGVWSATAPPECEVVYYRHLGTPQREAVKTAQLVGRAPGKLSCRGGIAAG
jgi:hypothetical protein